MMTLLDDLYEAVVDGDDDLAEELTARCLAANVDPQVIIDDALVPAMSEAGRRFETDEYFVPDLILSGRAIKAGLALISPLLGTGSASRAGAVVIGTVQGDLHDIGKNLVAVMLEGAGFEVFDLGTDVAPEEIVAAIREHQPELVGLSALLTTTMLSMPATIEAIEAAGLRDQVKVLIGGPPLSKERADEFGADAYADNANSAVRAAFELLGAR